MSRKPTTLWKPEDAEETPSAPEGYWHCSAALCVNLVGSEGSLCPDHQPKNDHSRSPRNVQLF